MNDWQQRTQTLLEKLAEQTLKQAEQGTLTEQRLERLSEKVELISEKVESLVDGQKHTDAKLDALTDIVRQLIERNGSG